MNPIQKATLRSIKKSVDSLIKKVDRVKIQRALYIEKKNKELDNLDIEINKLKQIMMTYSEEVIDIYPELFKK